VCLALGANSHLQTRRPRATRTVSGRLRDDLGIGRLWRSPVLEQHRARVTRRPRRMRSSISIMSTTPQLTSLSLPALSLSSAPHVYGHYRSRPCPELLRRLHLPPLRNRRSPHPLSQHRAQARQSRVGLYSLAMPWQATQQPISFAFRTFMPEDTNEFTPSSP
jgi:hypothetical protein